MKSRASKATLLLSLVLLAGFLLGLAWPRFQASFRYLPVDRAIDRYYVSREIPSNRLEVLIRFAEQAIDYNDHYRYYDGLSTLHLLRAQDINTPALERRGAYESAEREAKASVERAPAQPAAWLRLATIRWILHDEPEAVISAWKMSAYTGRTDSSLMAQRVAIGLAFFSFLDDEGMGLLRDQLLLAWRLQPGSLMSVLSRTDRQLIVTRQLVKNIDPDALMELEMWLERVR